MVNHTGGLDGMVSYVGFMPEEDIGVIVLTNSDEHRLHRALPLYVFDLLLGLDGIGDLGHVGPDLEGAGAR